MTENRIDLELICELKNKKFIVPNYQRGYKWRAKDVEYLIEDIAEITQEDHIDYCLQPIVVAPNWIKKVCPTCGHIILLKKDSVKTRKHTLIGLRRQKR